VFIPILIRTKEQESVRERTRSDDEFRFFSQQVRFRPHYFIQPHLIRLTEERETERPREDCIREDLAPRGAEERDATDGNTWRKIRIGDPSKREQSKKKKKITLSV
jgi:hypothetical protein